MTLRPGHAGFTAVALLLALGGVLVGRAAQSEPPRRAAPIEEDEPRPLDSEAVVPAAPRVVQATANAQVKRGTLPSAQPAAAPAVSEEADHRNWHHDALARHEREPRDRAWANEAMSNIDRALSQLKEQKSVPFDVRGIDCRNESCVAEIRFDSYASARANFGELLHGAYEVPCGVEVTLDEPREGDGPFDTTLYFSCSQRLTLK